MIDNGRIHTLARIHEPRLSALPNVNGVGVGRKIIRGEQTDVGAVMVFVRRKVPLDRLAVGERVPPEIDGVATDVVYADEIIGPRPPAYFPMALDGPDPTERYRPAPGGVSVGHYSITAGTLACAVVDRRTGKLAMLSNNHVLGAINAAKEGDEERQPGPYDGGDRIGAFDRMVLIEMGSGIPCPIAKRFCGAVNALLASLGRATRIGVMSAGANLVDAALAFPDRQEDLRRDILVIGNPEPEIAEAFAGLEVQKFGRTTRYTRDKIIAVDTTVQVNYGGPTATFERQLVAGPMSAGGDSGSLVLDMGNRPVGLLFAGSDQVTIMNPIQLVLDALDIEFVG